MKIPSLAAVFVLAAAPLARAADEKPTFHASRTETVTAKVKAVDQKKRMVTLVNDAGEEIKFKADERVKNLKQVKKGDVLSVTLNESIDARILKPGENPRVASEGSTMATAPQGSQPAAYAAKERYITATIAAIDKENMVVTLKGPDGNTFPVKARKKENVDKLAVGDNVEIHTTQAVGVEVSTPNK